MIKQWRQENSYLDVIEEDEAAAVTERSESRVHDAVEAALGGVPVRTAFHGLTIAEFEEADRMLAGFENRSAARTERERATEERIRAIEQRQAYLREVARSGTVVAEALENPDRAGAISNLQAARRWTVPVSMDPAQANIIRRRYDDEIAILEAMDDAQVRALAELTKDLRTALPNMSLSAMAAVLSGAGLDRVGSNAVERGQRIVNLRQEASAALSAGMDPSTVHALIRGESLCAGRVARLPDSD